MKTLAEQIKALIALMEEKFLQMESINLKASEEGRVFSEEEAAEFDTVKGEISGIEVQIDRLKSMEEIAANRAKAYTPAPAAAPAAPAADPAAAASFDKGYQVPDAAAAAMQVKAVDDLKQLPAGVLFSRIAIAKAIAKQNGQSFETIANHRWGDAMAKFTNAFSMRELHAEGIEKAAVATGVTTVDAWAGELVDEATAGFVDMLRNAQIVSKLSMRMMDFGDSQGIRMPRQTGGVTAGYVGENGSIRAQAQAYDAINLFPYKLAVLVPSSMELIRRSNPSIEMLVRDDMIASAAQVGDSQFMLGTASPGVSPGGIAVGLPASNTFAAAAGIAPDVDAVTAALGLLISAMYNANIPMVAPAWIMSPRVKNYLQMQRTTQGVWAWRDEINSGFLLGIPIVDSNTVPNDLGVGTNESYILLGDWNQVIYANGLTPTIDASNEATIESADDPSTPPDLTATPYSAWQQDGVVFRLRLEHDWQKRHDTCVASLTAVQWGATA